MCRVLVISTVHDPTLAEPAELQWLLGRLRPEVIFLEHPADRLDSFRDGSTGTLESIAVMRHVAEHPAALVPVDLDPSDHELPASYLKAHFDAMFETIAALSIGYREAEWIHRNETAKGGLAYLNSRTGWERESSLRFEMLLAVNNSPDQTLQHQVDLWEQWNRRREEAMVKRVEAYARAHPFAIGVLLVGAAHREPLHRVSSRPLIFEKQRVDWHFDWDI